MGLFHFKFVRPQSQHGSEKTAQALPHHLLRSNLEKVTELNLKFNDRSVRLFSFCTQAKLASAQHGCTSACKDKSLVLFLISTLYEQQDDGNSPHAAPSESNRRQGQKRTFAKWSEEEQQAVYLIDASLHFWSQRRTERSPTHRC